MTTTSTSDEELMAAVKADDLDQLVPLFERYHGPLFNYLTRLTNDRETSEDLTQTVFERILKYRSSYQPTQPFKAWVYQMARNVHADYWQRRESCAPPMWTWKKWSAQAACAARPSRKCE
ncbi:RNA polymerase sigma factor [Hymenobacter humi]|uniref:RNA polymerase sigma factor n=1 Tax=Hymenobacter humi TaxID=1411620 RepID=A0ABW2UD69_9BACT